MKNFVEVAAESVASALTAQEAGASRIELCENLAVGGTTPSAGLIEVVLQRLHIPIYPLIRPRGGDFVYTDLEFDVIQAEIAHCGKAGCQGVVIGLLLPDGSIDLPRLKELVTLAHQYGMGVTHHRAFDRCINQFKALEEIIEAGCERILTSGGQPDALSGADQIQQLIVQADNRIIIMPGAGVTPANAHTILKRTGATQIHGSFRSPDQQGILTADYHQIHAIV